MAKSNRILVKLRSSVALAAATPTRELPAAFRAAAPDWGYSELPRLPHGTLLTFPTAGRLPGM